MMTREEILQLFRDTGVLREGHFLMTSGLHTDRFLLCAQVLQYPQHTERLCQHMAAPFRDQNIDVVIGPAVGGILLAYETARALGCRSVFAEKVGDGRMQLKRQFAINPGDRVLVVEDAVSTGGSVRQVLEAIAPLQPEIVGVSVLVDRTAGRGDFGFGVPLHAVVSLDIPSWHPTECPLCKTDEPLIKPKA